jgi:hypothetical protein
MAKLYQHINSEDPLFQNTTKLLYVDDSDPDVLMYVFDDGSKCNADFIAKIDDINATSGQYHMIEVETPSNIWRFNPVEVKQETIKAKNAEGQEVEIPDPYFVGLSGTNSPLNGGGPIKEGTRWESRPPRPAVRPMEDINEYYASYIKYAVENNVDINKSINVKLVMDIMNGNTVVPQKTSQPAIAAQVEQPAVIENASLKTPVVVNTPIKEEPIKTKQSKPLSSNIFNETKKHLIINADDLIASNDYDIVELTINGEVHEIELSKFFNQAIEEQKVVEVNKPTIDMPMELTENDIEIDIINTPEWGLVNNMINMSQKEECSIDIELLLSLPPIDVYKLIKTAYPKGLSDAFVKTIANRMPIKELRLALAQGLMAYYDGSNGDIVEEDVVVETPVKETPIIPTTTEKKPAVKKPRTKKV